MRLRSPDQVMRLERLGSSHQTRLSFMRVLLRGLRRGDWRVDRPIWDVDARGVGRAVYCIRGQGQCYSLVAFAHDLPADQRSDRVIAEAWDATFALVDGVPTQDDLDRLAANVPLQEAGRVSDRELVLSRANRSVRLWDHVVESLAAGQQPDLQRVAEVGYLMRTTAVYGSGKFGAADFGTLCGRPLIDGPFRAEMLTVWLIRTFVADLVQHIAQARNPNAARLAPDVRRRFGIGNSTGLGMAPFLVNHPALLNSWITARETALARVRALPQAQAEPFLAAVKGMAGVIEGWQSAHPVQQAKCADLRRDVRLIADQAPRHLSGSAPWDNLWQWGARDLTIEGQEMLVSLVLEPHGPLIDDLAETMGANEAEHFRIDGAMSAQALHAVITDRFAWALRDYGTTADQARFWYTSAAKLEPRLGQRFDEPGAELEQPLDVGRAVAAMQADLGRDGTVADFLRSHPSHRHMVRRVQRAHALPYGEIHDNLLAADMRPIDMLRCKLAFFGATRFDPRSDRWVRITMYQGAPYPDELLALPEDAWALAA